MCVRMHLYRAMIQNNETDSSNTGTGQHTKYSKPRRGGVFELGERVQKCIQRLSSLTCVTQILLRHDHAWIFGQRILLEMLAFYAMVLSSLCQLKF